jgi:hypothetical protein
MSRTAERVVHLLHAVFHVCFELQPVRNHSVFDSSCFNQVLSGLNTLFQVTIYVRVLFLKIIDINTAKENFMAQVFIQLKWREPAFDGKTNIVREQLGRFVDIRCTVCVCLRVDFRSTTKSPDIPTNVTRWVYY